MPPPPLPGGLVVPVAVLPVTCTLVRTKLLGAREGGGSVAARVREAAAACADAGGGALTSCTLPIPPPDPAVLVLTVPPVCWTVALTAWYPPPMPVPAWLRLN